MDEWMNGWTDRQRQMDRWMDGQMDGWTDGEIDSSPTKLAELDKGEFHPGS